MAKILGLGGVFYRTQDTESYRAWWGEHMGVDITDWGTMEWGSFGGDDAPAAQGEVTRTMMSPFKADSDYFKGSDQPFMINLRVDDAAKLVEQARAGGATVIGEVEDTEFGIFGWFIDPEGIKIELWQPPSS